MDPITIGVSVGTLVVSQVTKKLIAKAVDPENVAKGVNWIFSAVEHFLKVRKKERPRDAPIPQPPVPTPVIEPSEGLDEVAVDKKIEAVKDIAKSLNQETQAVAGGGVHLVAMDQFLMEELASEVESLMNQLETYLGNLRFEEEKAAHYGGLPFVPPIVMNTIRVQQQEIAERVRRLNKVMQKVYGAAAPTLDIDTLVAVTRSKT